MALRGKNRASAKRRPLATAVRGHQQFSPTRGQVKTSGETEKVRSLRRTTQSLRGESFLLKAQKGSTPSRKARFRKRLETNTKSPSAPGTKPGTPGNRVRKLTRGRTKK